MTEKKEAYEPQFIVRIQETSDQKTTSFINPRRVTVQCGWRRFVIMYHPDGLIISARDGFLEMQSMTSDSIMLKGV